MVILITGIFGNILILRGDFAVLKREFPVALVYPRRWSTARRQTGVRVSVYGAKIYGKDKPIVWNYFTPTSSIHRYETRHNKLYLTLVNTIDLDSEY